MKTIWSRVYDFYDSDIDYYAASLSFFTIFSFMPISIVGLYVFSNVGLLDELHVYILALLEILLPNYQYLQEHVDAFFNFDVSIGIIGMSYVVLATFLFFRYYKIVVLQVLHIKRISIFFSFLFYISYILFIPCLIFFYFYIQKYFDVIMIYNPVIFLLFFIFYFFATLTSVNKKNLFLIFKISIFIGFLWEIVKYLYIIYTVYNKPYYTLYGSLSSIFFLLLWVYISWIIFLYGLKYYRIHHIPNKT